MSMLTTQSKNEFTTARQRAFIEEWLSTLSGKTTNLLSFEEVKQILNLHDSTYRGFQEIELDKIVGSTGRYRDFTRTFLPKNDLTQERWRRVDAVAHDQGFPPIEVYQVGEVYFVRDGNHRVSVARIHKAKTIEAEVVEYKTSVSLTKEDELDDILLKHEHTKFFAETKLDELRPDQDIVITEPGHYRLLEQHIAFHKYLKERELSSELSIEMAVTSWYDTVYMPVVKLIREQEVLKQFPGRTEADLYAWLLLHREILEKDMEALGYIPVEDVIEELKAEESHNLFSGIVNFFKHRSTRQNLPGKVARARFVDETGLDAIRPNHNIEFSEPGGYALAAEHISFHKFLRESRDFAEISYSEAASSWYDTVYLPMVKLVRARNLPAQFPANTEGDLYLWLISRRAELEYEARSLGQVSDEQLVDDFERENLPRRWLRWLNIRSKLNIRSLLLH